MPGQYPDAWNFPVRQISAVPEGGIIYVSAQDYEIAIPTNVTGEVTVILPFAQGTKPGTTFRIRKTDDGPSIIVRTPDEAGIDAQSELRMPSPRETYELRWDGIRWLSIGERAAIAATANGSQVIMAEEALLMPKETRDFCPYPLQDGEGIQVDATISAMVAGGSSHSSVRLRRPLRRQYGVFTGGSTTTDTTFVTGSYLNLTNMTTRSITWTNSRVVVRYVNAGFYPVRVRVVRIIDRIMVPPLPEDFFDVLGENWYLCQLPVIGFAMQQMNSRGPSGSAQFIGAGSGIATYDTYTVQSYNGTSQSANNASNSKLANVWLPGAGIALCLFRYRENPLPAIADTAAFLSESAGKWGMTANANGFTTFAEDAGGLKSTTMPLASNSGWHLGMSKLEGGKLYAGLDKVWNAGVDCGDMPSLASLASSAALLGARSPTTFGSRYHAVDIGALLMAPGGISQSTIEKTYSFLKQLMPSMGLP